MVPFEFDDIFKTSPSEDVRGPSSLGRSEKAREFSLDALSTAFYFTTPLIY